MDYSALNDLNQAACQDHNFRLIPAGTLVKASVCIRPGGQGPNGWFTRSRSSSAIYLLVDFTVVEREYRGCLIRQIIGVRGAQPNEHGEDIWGEMGRSMLRAIVESAYNLYPSDQSETAKQKRRLKAISDINTLVCGLKVGIETDNSGTYSSRNKIIRIITPDLPQYQTLMGNPVFNAGNI